MEIKFSFAELNEYQIEKSPLNYYYKMRLRGIHFQNISILLY